MQQISIAMTFTITIATTKDMSAINLIAWVALSGCAVFASGAGAANFPYNRLFWVPNSETGEEYPVIIQSRKLMDFKGIMADPNDIHFYLFTPKNLAVPDELVTNDLDSLERSSFIRGAPLKVLTHGFASGINTGYPAHIRDAYLAWGEPMNLILVDWSQLAAPPLYNVAAANTKLVGEMTGRLLAWLQRLGVYSDSNLHIAGIDLGAHVAGNTGSALTSLTGLKAARVTGLDPAGPLFTGAPFEKSIDPSDGEFVDVIHTSGGFLGGLFEPRGHVDFYPNGGSVQPGCAAVDGGCSHLRAYEFYLESIHRGSTRFSACLCDDWAQFDSGDCPCAVKADMGEPTSPSTVHGSYFLRTAAAPPFALP